MKYCAWMRVLLVLAVAVGVGACRAYPTRSIYRRPSISSVVAFPNVLGPGDSTLVTVNATDPDGDSLVYDWFTDGRLDIKDGFGRNDLYNTSSNAHVFYRAAGTSSNDTAGVWCTARDGRGGSDSRAVLIVFRD